MTRRKEDYLPKTFSVETVLGCNLKCPECAIGGGIVKRKKGMMSFDRFKIIADKIRPFAKYLYLHIWGEPMINKDIIKMIKYSSEFVRTNIHTNGNSLTKKTAEELITSGVADLSISIDGFTQEVYEKYRVKGDVNKAFKQMETLYELNKKYGNPVNLSTQFIVFKHNHHEMNLFRNKCMALGIPFTFKAPYLRKDSLFQESHIKKYTRKKSPDLKTLKVDMSRCENAKNVFTILLDGSVVLCCYDHNRETYFGNIFEQDVLEIWNSEKFRSFRSSILEGNPPDFCLNNCLLYTMEEKNSLKNLKGRTAEELNSEGEELFLKGNVPAAVNAFEKAIDAKPDFLLPYNNLGVLSWQGGNIKEASDYFTKALKINPFHKTTILNYGNILEGLKEKESAIKLYKSYLKKYPEDKDILDILHNLEGEKNYVTASGKNKVNLCSGSINLDGYINVDITPDADITIDLEKELLPFPESHIDVLICMSAINYFTRDRAGEIIKDIYRVLKPGGITRFGTQDLRKLAGYYVNEDKEFFFQKLPDGRERFPGKTMADKLNEWFYGYKTFGEKFCKYVYDFETLKLLFEEAGFEEVREKNYMESSLENIDKIDNRPEQMFYLEARKKGGKEWKAETENKENSKEYLISYGIKPHRVFSDEEHLKASMEWLLKSQNTGADKGSSAMYYIMEDRWHTSYPETTGYIIPTFLNYYHLTGNDLYLKKAIDMGNWEIEIQVPEGGIGEPKNAPQEKPRVFNTAQVIFGFISLYGETGKNKYLEAAVKAADWIVKEQHSDGKWEDFTHGGPKSVHIRTAWPLLELYNITKNEIYKISAEKFVDWVLKQGLSNGWFYHTNISTAPNKPWTHLIAYVLRGLYEVYSLKNSNVNRAKILRLLYNASEAICNVYKSQLRVRKNYCGLPGTFDENWSSTDNYSCLTGNAQLSIFLNKFGNMIEEEGFIKVSHMLIEDLKKVHYLDEISNPNLTGGLAGSHPFNTGYCAGCIPNWSVKFLADSLMVKIREKNDDFKIINS